MDHNILNNVKFSEFTRNYINYIYKTTFKLPNNNIYKILQIEKRNIIVFIKLHYNIEIQYEFISSANDYIDRDVYNYGNNNRWVDFKQLTTELTKMSNVIIIKWKSLNNTQNNINKMIIKSYNNNIDKNRIKYIILIFEFLKQKIKVNKPITIYLLLTNLQKQFPIYKNQKLTKSHVNSGYFDSLNNIIFIWRKEEIEKVLLHEMIHFIDFTNHITNFHLPLLNLEYSQYFEAIADFWGIFYHIILISLKTKISVNILFNIEYLFVMNQAQRLNAYFNLNDWKNISEDKITQETSAFSYYILKYILFDYFIQTDLEILIKFITNSNDKYFTNRYYTKFFNMINKSFRFKQTEFIYLKSNRMSILQLI